MGSLSAPQVNQAQVVTTVTNQLQPLISDAVARALRGARAGAGAGGAGVVGGAGGLTPEEEAEYNKKLSSNAQYEYGYKVADDDAQAYMAHEEVRNGQNVEGKYNYVDANGALVTVTYQADPDGYTENREVQDGAVQMRNIPGPWEGPYADTVPAGVSSAPAPTPPTSSAVSQAEIIQRIQAALLGCSVGTTLSEYRLQSSTLLTRTQRIQTLLSDINTVYCVLFYGMYCMTTDYV